MRRKYVILHFFFYIMVTSASQNGIDESTLVKRDTLIDDTRQDLHVRVLKYFSGRYKSLPTIDNIDEQDTLEPPTTTEGSTTMEALIKVTATTPADELNMKMFGGYFTSVLGNSLAYYFNVTSTKIHSTPSYAMVHHYFRGDFTSPHGAFIGEANFGDCAEVVNFCPIGSKQICLKNGTIYCVTPMSSTVLRPIEGLQRPCLRTKVTVQCRRGGLKSCEKMIPLHIPCYATVTMVEGDECARNKVYKDRYCVLIIAYPLPKYSNSEFMDYLRTDEEGQRIVNHQFNTLADVILKTVFQ